MNEQLDNLIRQWSSLGAGFDAPPLPSNIDLERLVLDTARHSAAMPRLFIMAATWLHTYGDLIAKHRLKRLVRDEMDAEYQPVLGLLLDLAQQGSHPPEFQSILRALKPARTAGLLFDISRQNAVLASRAHHEASSISRRWKLWCQPFEFKTEALRPPLWMMARQPHLRCRADFRGDLRASILASLQHDAGAGESELKLARLAGGSRAQVRAALRNLEMTGRVECQFATGANRRQISLARVA